MASRPMTTSRMGSGFKSTPQGCGIDTSFLPGVSKGMSAPLFGVIGFGGKKEALMDQQGPSIQVKLTDDILGGVYSNSMQVTHTREEFVLDFMSIFPPAGKVNARV